MVDGRNFLDGHTRIERLVPQATGASTIAALPMDALTVFNGLVYIGENASQSATEQNANLLLSDTAEINPKPELQIHNDDVVASHGSTVGNLDEEQLFYLRQRGIFWGPKAAPCLTFAFAEQIAQALPSQPLADYLEARFAQDVL